MTETLPLDDALIILAAAIVFVPLFQRLKVSPVLGYLAAGLAIGPHGAGLIAEPGGARLLAEFGVIFLLFAIGLELPWARLTAMRRYIFGLGFAQVALTSLVIGGIALASGMGSVTALVLGGALALSSTAAVLQHLVERGETTARYGRVSIGVLLFQDLAVVPLLVLLPLLAGGVGDAGGLTLVLGFAAAKAAAVLVAIALVGRFVIRPVFRLIASTRNPELFAATSIFVALGTGWATEHAGMSMALGAFLAGLMLADSEYRHQIEADIQPFRGLFLGLFFMAVGMSVDLRLMLSDAGTVFGLAAALLTGKAALLIGLGLAFGLGLALSARVGLLLAQCGEFAFVIAGFAVFKGVMPAEIAQIILLVVAVTMAATPLLAAAGRRMSGFLERESAHGADRAAEEGGALDNHVVIAGFGRVGRTVAELLTAQGVPYVALDQDPARVAECRALGLPVFYGDASRSEVMNAIGVRRARAVAITLDKPGPAERAVGALRQGHPAIPIVVRGRDLADLERLEGAGATAVVPEALEGSLQLGATVLRLTGRPNHEIEEALDLFREDDYAKLKPFQASKDDIASEI